MFFSKLEWFIAVRYLKTKRKESFIKIISWFSLIGITLGVAVLIIVMSVMNGFRKDLVASIVGIEGHLSVQNVNGSFLNGYPYLIKEIKDVKEVTNVAPSITTQALLSSKDYSTGVMVKGITLADILARKVKLEQEIPNANNRFSNGEKVIFVGKLLAQSLGLNVGDEVRAVFPQMTSTITGFIPKYVTFKVAGLFNTGMYQYDSNMIFIPLPIAQILYSTKGTQYIEVFTKNPENVDSIRDDIHQKIGDDLYITTWKENNFSLINALNTERNVMFIILVLIIMIAAFNIMSSLIMLVRSKTKEIAILKTVGFSAGSIQKIFLIIGLRTGIMGTFMGVILGVTFSLNIERIRTMLQDILHVNLFNENVYFLSHIPAEVSFVQIFTITLISILLSIVASIYPSKKAAKIITAEALRYE
ncbi:lipoprotein-releasing ABC transporter permease subunit [Rickettsiales bacterium LUAb2]